METLAANNDLLQAVVNMTAELQTIWPILMKLISFVGFMFVVASVLTGMNPQYAMMMRSAMSGMPSKVAIVFFFCGILMINISTFVFHISESVFRNSSLSVLSYQALKTGVKDTSTVGVYLNFFVAVVMLVGLLSVLKGIIGYATQGGSAQALGAALMHIGVGSICINITVFMTHVGASLGGVYQSQIDKFF